MQYVLKKDLPTYKAGTPCHISAEGNLVDTQNGIVLYRKSTLQKFPNILTEWFEPIWVKVVPKDKENHYQIYASGMILFAGNSSQKNTDIINQGNWRWTKEEAEAEVAKRAAIERVRRYLVENDLLETDKTKVYKVLHVCNNKVQQDIASLSSFYSPYGRIKRTYINQFLEDCRADLLLIHS